MYYSLKAEAKAVPYDKVLRLKHICFDQIIANTLLPNVERLSVDPSPLPTPFLIIKVDFIVCFLI